MQLKRMGEKGENHPRSPNGPKGDFEGDFAGTGGTEYPLPRNHPSKPTDLAEKNGFRLCVRHTTGGWVNLKLSTDRDLPKRNWWISWNGERLAQSFDARRLAEQHPFVLDWVLSELRLAFPAEAMTDPTTREA